MKTYNGQKHWLPLAHLCALLLLVSAATQEPTAAKDEVPSVPKQPPPPPLPKESAVRSKRPNIVLFVADDLGIGDVGCFGNDTLRTPNIDRIAKEGVKLSHHLAPSSVCTPSRAAFLTGRYPIRSGMVPSHLVRVNIFVSSISGLPPEETTFAELAKEQGYKTALIGKWHLGLHSTTTPDYRHHPLNQGFDYFYGIPLTNLKDFGTDGYNVIVAKFPVTYKAIVAVLIVNTLFFIGLWAFGFITHKGFIILLLSMCIPVFIFHWIFDNMKFLNSVVMRNLDVVEQPLSFDNLTQRLVNEGVEFMEKAKYEEEPFLLVMSWIQVHTVLYNSEKFTGRSKHGQYGDTVEELDWSVGEILNAMDRLGLAEDTFVYLTSDNGGHIEEKGLSGAREGGHNGIFRGGKGQGGSEGGIRVPTVARWPGHIPPDTEVATPTSMMDILPSLAHLWRGPIPDDRMIDGKNIIPLLAGQDISAPHEFMFHYCGVDIHSARYVTNEGADVYKAHYATYRWEPGTEGCGFMCDCYGGTVLYHDTPILFNIARDPGETQPLDVKIPQYRDIIAAIDHAKAKHQQSIEPVTNQYNPFKMVPIPWLQPCCEFPKCVCRDKKYLNKSPTKKVTH